MKTKVAVGILIIIGGVLFFHKGKKSDDELMDTTYDYARTALKNKLKDPGSLKTKDLTFTGHRTNDGGMAGAVCGQFNAKNSYGGYGGFEYFIAQIKVDKEGKLANSGGVSFPGDNFSLFCKLSAKNYFPS